MPRDLRRDCGLGRNVDPRQGFRHAPRTAVFPVFLWRSVGRIQPAPYRRSKKRASKTLGGGKQAANHLDAGSIDPTTQPAPIPKRCKRGVEKLRQQNESVVAGSRSVQEIERSLWTRRLRSGALAAWLAHTRSGFLERYFRAHRRRRICSVLAERGPRHRAHDCIFLG